MAETLTYSDRASEAGDRAEEQRQAYSVSEEGYPDGELEHGTALGTRTQDSLALGVSNLMALEQPLTKDQQEGLDATLWGHEHTYNHDDEARAA